MARYRGLLSTVFAVLFVCGFEVQASQVQADGSAVIYSCGYASGKVGIVRLRYTNPELPTESAVRLHWWLSGFRYAYENGRSVRVPLEYPSGPDRGQNPLSRQYDPEMTQVSPGVYEITLNFAIQGRSESMATDTLKFAFMQFQPQGQYWDKPGRADQFGYYQVEVKGTDRCFDPSHPDIPLRSLTVKSVVP